MNPSDFLWLPMIPYGSQWPELGNIVDNEVEDFVMWAFLSEHKYVFIKIKT